MLFIPPQLREDLDEISQSRRGTLPQLVTEQDIRGDLHTHTTASDGVDPSKKWRAQPRISAMNTSASRTTRPA
jgi:hypothetical protein